MTASWGMMGYLWNKPVVNVMYVHSVIPINSWKVKSALVLCFFDEELKDVLKYCGFSFRERMRIRLPIVS